ncbi:unnamed protein product [Rotaria magnacalcarata]|uniref:Uncharacterized protein n=1 Tax=Rotaria magnacalcarata TaxID=392030 RepID=A0A816QR74_9BILA|nr:unnamed protein product [Rotaria magnacalcarata]CAF2065208.1 unnamed protein product [Rotaria magnacalcarata]CAF3913630.1 unnamed protein product [Rotaria magnacalcarata]CAF5163249.1 unnamed protein product [Rotaria magnacalcarata]
MNFSSLTSDTIFMLLLSLQRISRNLSHILHTLDADLNSFRQLLTEFASSILESSSSSIIEEKEEINDYILEKNEDFYEELFDEILEPKPRHVTTV